jgi:hypothetical protein
MSDKLRDILNDLELYASKLEDKDQLKEVTNIIKKIMNLIRESE